jgi:hypothetical protein
MAALLSPEEIDALDLSQPPAPPAPSQEPARVLSPDEIDNLDLSTPPSPAIQAFKSSLPTLSRAATSALPDITGTSPIATKIAGAGLGAIVGGVSDIAEKVAGLPEQKENGWRNFKAGISNEPLPIKETLNHPDVGGVLDKVSMAGLDLIPRIYLMRGLGAAGAGPSASAAAAFGFDEHGKVSPVGAALGALMPGMAEVGRTVADSVTQKLIDKGLLAAGNKFARNLASEVGAVASIQSLNEALNTPKLAQLYAQDPKEFWKQIAADTLSSTAFVLASAPEWAGSKGPWSDAMRTTIEKTYTPQQLRDIFIRNDQYVGQETTRKSGVPVETNYQPLSKDEQDIVQFVGRTAGAMGRGGRGISVTTSEPWIKSPYWQKFFNIAGPEVKMAVLGE